MNRGGVIPIEGKDKNGAALSPNRYLEEDGPACAYKLVSGNVGVSGVKVTLPLYMAIFL